MTYSVNPACVFLFHPGSMPVMLVHFFHLPQSVMGLIVCHVDGRILESHQCELIY